MIDGTPDRTARRIDHIERDSSSYTSDKAKPFAHSFVFH
jgi:hypothetical protein